MKTKRSSDNINNIHAESKHSDSLLSSIIESPDNIVIFALDRDYGYTAFNTNHKLTIKKIWDADIEIGMNMLEIIKAPQDQKKAKHNFDRVLNGERFTLIEEYGEPPNRFYYENIYNPIFDDTHKVTGLSVFLTDITEKKKTEDELNKYRNQLEDLVVQRTQELVAAKYKLEQDIADLNQAEETLAKSEQRYRSLYEDSLAATYTSTLSGNILDCNENFVHIMGYKSPDEIIGKKSQDLYFSSNDRKQFLSDLTEHNQLITYESRMKRKDGQEVWIMENVSLLDQDTIQGTMFDITEHRKTVVALGESEERFRSLFENATIGLYRTTPDGQILLANPALVHMLGYTTYEELCNRNLDKEGFEGRYSRGEFIDRIDKEGQISGLESTWKKSDGTWIHIRESAKVSRDEEGSIRYYEGTVEDITERKKSEVELKQSNTNFKNIYNLTSDAIFIKDENLRILEVNKAAEELFGFTREELLGVPEKTLGDKTKNDYKLVDKYVEKALNGVSQRFEWWGLKMDGTSFPEEILINVTVFNGRNILLFTIRDMTERKRVEKELSNYRNRLEEMVTARTAELESFAYSVSHDLRAPLRAIGGFSQIFMDEYEDQLDDEGKRLQKIITDATCKMDALINDILTLSRLGMREMANQKVDMAKLVEDAKNQVMAEVTERTIRWKIHKLPPVQGDRSLLHQAMINMITNAVKFTRPQKKTVIEIGCQTEANGSTYYVKDNGVGINMEYSNQLFKVFQRQHSDEEFEGTGIGLAIVHRIISRHNGRVWADGEVDKGATFYFWLPNR